jgi:thiosulfate/3-mercaptopyruvate sulfurtransferase
MKRARVFGVLFVCCLFILSLTGSTFAAWGGKELETETSAVKFSNEVIRGAYKVVSTEDLKKWIDEKKKMLIIDTMPYEDSYKKEHVPGAMQFEFPIPEVTNLDDKTKEAFLKMLGPDKYLPIVIYCGFVKCTRSHNGAMWAVKLGYKNVYRYPGGIKAWKEADYPIEKVK